MPHTGNATFVQNWSNDTIVVSSGIKMAIIQIAGAP